MVQGTGVFWIDDVRKEGTEFATLSVRPMNVKAHGPESPTGGGFHPKAFPRHAILQGVTRAVLADFEHAFGVVGVGDFLRKDLIFVLFFLLHHADAWGQ